MSSIPKQCADIDAAWLNTVLSSEVRGGAMVTDVGVEIIGEGVGFVGELARLTLRYDQPTVDSTTTMIAKLPTTNPGFRHIGTMLGLYRKEHGFYADVAHTVPVSVPAVYVNGADLLNGEYVLLMEDMAPRRAGNQIESCSTEEAELALRELAGLHAAWWEHPDLDRLGEWLPSVGDPYFDLIKGAYTAGLPKLAPVFGHLLSDHVIELAARNLERWDVALKAGMDRTPHTFVHGDFRLDNMMFEDAPTGVKLTVLDWQLPFRANPMCDVVYFLVGNLDPERRRAEQDHLLHVYHDALLAAGVAGYTFDHCEEDYRASGLVLLGYLVTIAGEADLDSFNERGREVMELMVRRYSTGIEDLGSASFLP
jgi:hypothetical protein